MRDIDPVLESKDWKAWEDHEPPAPVSFHVTGTVVVIATNYRAWLEKAAPQGINPKILLLKLIVEATGDVGGDAITNLPVEYSEVDYDPGSYVEVTILRSGTGGAHIPEVEVAR